MQTRQDKNGEILEKIQHFLNYTALRKCKNDQAMCPR